MKPKISRKLLRRLKRQERKTKRSKNFTIQETSVPSANVARESCKKSLDIRMNCQISEKKKVQTQRIKRLQEDNLQEEEMIRRLEKKLKLNKKRSHLPKIFIAEGLNYLLEVCDQEKFDRNIVPSDAANDAFEDPESVDNLSCRSVHDFQSEDDGIEINYQRKNGNNEKVISMMEEMKKKSDLLEERNDLMRVRNENIDEKERAKYVPPQLKREYEDNLRTESEKLLQIRKQMKGLLNRLAGKNAYGIIKQIENLYETNSRHNMNCILCELLKESLVRTTSSSIRMVAEHALLICVLHTNIGPEIGSYMLQKFIEEFHILTTQCIVVEDKRLDNVVAILAQLYNFKLFHSNLIYEILENLMEKFEEKDIDLILLILKSIGFNLRKDDPARLKAIIFNAQNKANACLNDYSKSMRTKFMLDTLLAIKNNNKLKVLQSDSDYVDSLKKLSKTFTNTGKYVTELKISLQDLLSAETSGRWWIVGSAWNGNTASGQNERQNMNNNAVITFNQTLCNIAKKHRMNTDIRKHIFCIIMSSEDFLDAFEKLLKLGLKGRQCQEIIYVVMYCMLQEKEYNPYYSFIVEQFVIFHRKYQMAVQYCSWDKFKEINSFTDQQIFNFSQFLAHLIRNEQLSISILKVLQFTEMNKSMIKLIRQLLLNLLSTDNEAVIANIFGVISRSSKLIMLREGLQLFLHHFILNKACKEQYDNMEQNKAILKKKIRIAENAMHGVGVST